MDSTIVKRSGFTVLKRFAAAIQIITDSKGTPVQFDIFVVKQAILLLFNTHK